MTKTFKNRTNLRMIKLTGVAAVIHSSLWPTDTSFNKLRRGCLRSEDELIFKNILISLRFYKTYSSIWLYPTTFGYS